jgi:hypothetical protein
LWIDELMLDAEASGCSVRQQVRDKTEKNHETLSSPKPPELSAAAAQLSLACSGPKSNF